VDAAGVRLPPGSQGEVFVRTPGIARGYVTGAPAGPSPFRDGGFLMGDLGWLDDEGFLTIAGRKDALINVAGLKVAPEEVAAALERHPLVREAAVMGAPTPAGDFVVVAAVVTDRQVAEADLIEHCRALLAEHKVPRRIQSLRALPRTATGKVRITLEDLQL
jgi:long-chain acyl-CoA synthetase